MSDLVQGRIVTEREISNVLGVKVTTITGLTEPHVSHDRYKITTPDDVVVMEFHSGALSEGMAHGVLNESLIDILVHRIECLDKEIPCEENLLALAGLKQARDALTSRVTRVTQETA